MKKRKSSYTVWVGVWHGVLHSTHYTTWEGGPHSADWWWVSGVPEPYQAS